MGKKSAKRPRETLEELLERPFCYYCGKDFDHQGILHDHQKAKHFKCIVGHCNRRLNTVGGLRVHMQQVHKEELAEVPNAIDGRKDPSIEIFNMYGIPDDIVQQHRQAVEAAYYRDEAEHRARTGNPAPGTENSREQDAKKPKTETKEELRARLAKRRVEMAAKKAAEANSTPVSDNDSPGQSMAPADGSQSQSPAATMSANPYSIPTPPIYQPGFPPPSMPGMNNGITMPFPPPMGLNQPGYPAPMPNASGPFYGGPPTAYGQPNNPMGINGSPNNPYPMFQSPSPTGGPFFGMGQSHSPLPNGPFSPGMPSRHPLPPRHATSPIQLVFNSTPPNLPSRPPPSVNGLGSYVASPAAKQQQHNGYGQQARFGGTGPVAKVSDEVEALLDMGKAQADAAFEAQSRATNGAAVEAKPRLDPIRSSVAHEEPAQEAKQETKHDSKSKKKLHEKLLLSDRNGLSWEEKRAASGKYKLEPKASLEYLGASSDAVTGVVDGGIRA